MPHSEKCHRTTRACIYLIVLVTLTCLPLSFARAQSNFVAGKFEGTVIEVNDLFNYFGGQFIAGDSFAGTYGYDPAQLIFPPPGDGSFYRAYQAGPGAAFFNVEVGSIPFQHAGPFTLIVQNRPPGGGPTDPPGGDAYAVFADLQPFAPAPPNTLVTNGGFNFQFGDDSGQVFNSDLPPPIIPALSDFPVQPFFGTISYAFWGPNPEAPEVFDQFLGISYIAMQFTGHGPINIAAAAPEPGTVVLLVSAGIAVLIARRRRSLS